jgi:hypothetical protein
MPACPRADATGSSSKTAPRSRPVRRRAARGADLARSGDPREPQATRPRRAVASRLGEDRVRRRRTPRDREPDDRTDDDRRVSVGRLHNPLVRGPSDPLGPLDPRFGDGLPADCYATTTTTTTSAATRLCSVIPRPVHSAASAGSQLRGHPVPQLPSSVERPRPGPTPLRRQPRRRRLRDMDVCAGLSQALAGRANPVAKDPCIAGVGVHPAPKSA